MNEGEPKFNANNETEKVRISHDRMGREYEGGEIADRVMPDDFDSNDPITTDAEGNMIRGAKLKKTEETL